MPSSTTPAQARDVLLEAFPALVDRYGDMAATLTAEWYEETRQRRSGRGTYAAVLAEAVDARVSEQNVRWAARHLFEDGDPTSTMRQLEGAISRHVMDASRNTIIRNTNEDSASSGWYRQAEPDACEFCQMLAGRGSVYSRGSVDFEAHDNCRCEALPEW